MKQGLLNLNIVITYYHGDTKMTKKHNDENLFDLQLETEDIKLPGDLSMRVPTVPDKKGGTTNPNPDEKPNILDNIPHGEMPPLLAVDIAEGETPGQGVITSAPPVEQQTETVVAPEKKETIEPEKTETTPPATQGQQGDSGKDTDKEENLSPTYLHAAALHESGVLPNLDLESIKDLKPEEILNKLIESNRQEVIDQAEALNNQYKGQFNDDQKRIIEMFDQGIPFDDAANTVYSQLRYDQLDEASIKESPEIQEQLYREFLYAKGHKDTYVNNAVKQSKDLEKLEEDALTSHIDLQQMAKEEEVQMREQAKVQKTQQETRNAETLKTIKSEVSGTTEIIQGMEVTKADQAKILEYMTVPAAEIMQDGRRIQVSKKDEIRRSNPLEFEKRLAYFIHLGLFDEKPVLDKLEKKGETNAVKKLSEVLEGSAKGPQGGSPNISDHDKNSIQGKEGDSKFFLPDQISTVRSH